MKWFKHFSDNHRGQSIQALLDKFGHAGPCAYYFILEMCNEKLDQLDDRSLSEDDCVFTFHRRVVCSAVRMRPSLVTQLLNYCGTIGLLSVRFQSEFIEIKMPILLDLLESDQKKSRSKRVTFAIQSRLEENKNRIEQNRIEKNILTPEAKNLPAKVSKAALRGCLPDFEFDEVCSRLLANVTHKAQNAWLEAYPSVDFITQEIRRANAWIETNPQKRPRDFGKFMLSWLSRAFENYRKGLPSNQKTQAQKVQDANDELRRKIEAEEKAKGGAA